METLDPSRLVGKVLHGHYKIEALAGEGGMAYVYRATHQILQGSVALKILRRSYQKKDEFRERFLREIKAQNHLTHPNVVRVFDYIDEQGLIGCVQEWCNTGTLEDQIREQNGPLPLKTIQKHFLALLDAFIYIHEQNLFHRDVKPSNILLHEERGTVLWKMNDFGLVKDKKANELTHSGNVMGTPLYMSPEQLQACEKIDHRTDIYSLGVVLYRLLLGSLPFDTNMPRLGLQIINEPPHIPKDLHPKLKEVLQTSLAKAPGDRYKTCQAFKQHLGAALEEALQEPSQGQRAPASSQKVRRSYTPARTIIKKSDEATLAPNQDDKMAASSPSPAVSQAGAKASEQEPIRTSLESPHSEGKTEDKGSVSKPPKTEEISASYRFSSTSFQKALFFLGFAIVWSLLMGTVMYLTPTEEKRKPPKKEKNFTSPELKKYSFKVHKQFMLRFAISKARAGIWGETRFYLKLLCGNHNITGCYWYAFYLHHTLEALRASCKTGDPTGCHWTKMTTKRKTKKVLYTKKSIPIYKKACHLGKARACMALASVYQKEMPDQLKAKNYMDHGCSLWLGKVCLRMADFDGPSPHQTTDNARAKIYLEKACLGYEPEGCIRLGKAYLRRKSKGSQREAYKWFTVACQQSDRRGCIMAKALQQIK